MTRLILARHLIVGAVDEITRDGAREAAQRELAKPVYRVGQPTLLQRSVHAVLDWLGRQVGNALGFLPGGFTGLAVLLLVAIAVVLLVIAGRGYVRARDPLADRRRGARSLSAADYRAEAERLAAAGDWREALRARFRAVIRELEERGVLDPRPGRTAGEIAAEGGRAVPAIGKDLRTAADVFNEVWYGGRVAGAEHYATMRAVDDRVRGARLVTAI